MTENKQKTKILERLINSRAFNQKTLRNFIVNFAGFQIVDDGLIKYSSGIESRTTLLDRRSLNLYLNGFNWRNDDILTSYCLRNFDIGENQTVVDCGANVGDFFFAAMHQWPTSFYIGIEPDPRAFRCLKANITDSKFTSKAAAKEFALGAKNNDTKFFLSSTTADSSLSANFEDVIGETTVNTITLDAFLDQHAPNGIGLLKLEAQGHELSILEAASKEALRSLNFLAIDGCNERGSTRGETLSECTNFLLKSGFNLMSVNLSGRYPGRALFKNSLN